MRGAQPGLRAPERLRKLIARGVEATRLLRQRAEVDERTNDVTMERPVAPFPAPKGVPKA